MLVNSTKLQNPPTVLLLLKSISSILHFSHKTFTQQRTIFRNLFVTFVFVKMAFFIDSNDVTENPYDGTFTFPIALQGHYTILQQNFLASTINWCNSSNNKLAIWKSDKDPVMLTFANISSAESEDIEEWFHTAFLPVTTSWNMVLSVTYNSDTRQYKLQFSNTVSLGTLLPSEVKDEDPAVYGSTIAALFDWTPNGTGLIPNKSDGTTSNTNNIFYISDVNMGSPDLLEVTSPQILPKVWTNSTEPVAFLVHTDSGKIINQDIFIPTSTSKLDLQVKRIGQTAQYLNAKFLLYFKPQ